MIKQQQKGFEKGFKRRFGRKNKEKKKAPSTKGSQITQTLSQMSQHTFHEVSFELFISTIL